MLKGDFARVCMDVDVTRPLVLGVSLCSLDDSDWHEFLYENIIVLCYCCEILRYRSSDSSALANCRLKYKAAATMQGGDGQVRIEGVSSTPSPNSGTLMDAQDNGVAMADDGD